MVGSFFEFMRDTFIGEVPFGFEWVPEILSIIAISAMIIVFLKAINFWNRGGR